MKIFQNIFKPEIIRLIINEFDRLKNYQCWGSSHSTWESGLTDPFIGQCLVTSPGIDMKNAIIENTKKYLPEFEELTVQYYYWCKNSGIAWHNDNGYKFGATIYLNTDWKINYGGLFIWEENHRYNVQLPEFNTMVLNDEMQGHMVTTISNSAPYDRMTIQIWSK